MIIKHEDTFYNTDNLIYWNFSIVEQNLNLHIQYSSGYENLILRNLTKEEVEKASDLISLLDSRIFHYLRTEIPIIVLDSYIEVFFK
jgi:hypothetical protein